MSILSARVGLYRVRIDVPCDGTSLSWLVRASSPRDATERIERMCGILRRFSSSDARLVGVPVWEAP